jgi:hypothetical protein
VIAIRAAAPALGVIVGVDNQLVRDGSYILSEVEGVVVDCGAWSRRANKFGSEAEPGKSDALLEIPLEDGVQLPVIAMTKDLA